MLGVRPKIQSNESLTSYLLRLAAVNGFLTLPHFLSALGMEKVKQKGFGLWTDKQLFDLYQCLPAMLGREINDIKAQYDTLSNIPWLDNDVYYESDIVDFPRVCISCLLNNSIIDWRWSVALTPCCPTHRTPLINNCPHCHAPLKWHTSIFDACHKCKTKWKDISINAPHYPKVLLDKLFPALNGDIQLTSEQRYALRLSIVFMARPFDAVIDEVCRFPETPHFWARVMRAIYLLTQPWYKTLWKTENYQRWPSHLRNICPIAVFDSADLQSSWDTGLYQLPRTSSLAMFNEADECIEYLQPHRRKLQKQDKSLSFWFHINHMQLATTLDITTSSLIKLTDINLIPSVNHTKIIRDRIFDVNTVHRFISPLFSTLQQDKPIILSEKSRLLSSYLMRYGEAIKAVVEGNLTGYFIEAHSFAKLSVDSDKLQTWLSTQFKEKCQSPIVKSAAAKALGVLSPTIDIYVKQGRIHWAPWSSQYQQVDGQSFYRFHKPPKVSELKSTSK